MFQALKPSLFKFMTNALRLPDDKERAKLSDLGRILYQTMRPWSNQSEFLSACFHLNELFVDSKDKKGDILNRQLLSKLEYSSISAMTSDESFATLAQSSLDNIKTLQE